MTVPAVAEDAAMTANNRRDELQLPGLGIHHLDSIPLEAEDKVAGGRSRVGFSKLETFGLGRPGAGPRTRVRCPHMRLGYTPRREDVLPL